MKQKTLPMLIILIQISSSIWYFLPRPKQYAVHVSIEFIGFMIFGTVHLILIAIYTLIYFLRKKEKTFIGQLPFVLLVIILGITFAAL